MAANREPPMRLSCPCCFTAFHVAPAAIGAGRDVRCGRCEVVWFATQPVAEVEIIETPSVTKILAARALRAPAVAPTAPAYISVDDEPIIKALASITPAEARSIIPDEGVVTAADEQADIIIDSEAFTADEEYAAEAPLPPRVSRRPAKPKRPRDRLFALSAATGVLALVVFCGFVARTTLVRFVPDLAGFYAAVGLGVNLRGLEFRSVRTAQASQDGIPVLVVEGEIANVTSQTMEIPKLRLAVLGKEGRELYAWTSQLPRASLMEGEQIPFKSRLAAPPAEAQQVFVRFITRGDATGSIR
jgi:predicted Zn finger-like uncharacterized protein